MNYFDMDAPWPEHFVYHKLLIEAMTPNLSLVPTETCAGKTPLMAQDRNCQRTCREKT